MLICTVAVAISSGKRTFVYSTDNSDNNCKTSMRTVY